MKYVLYAILILVLYQFIFKLVIPVYRASRRIKKGFREMQDKMNQHQQYQSPQETPQTASRPKPASEDYIEFEELKKHE